MVIARAPLRISFGGGGTDLEAYYRLYGGLVVSVTITRYCYVVASEPSQGGVHLTSSNLNLWESCPAGATLAVAEPLALPKAAIEIFRPRLATRAGLGLFLASDVPPGTGLGSSSAMAVALLRALAAYTGQSLTTKETAETACWLEIERLGMPIGKQDQYASAYGGLNTIEFSGSGVQVTPLRLPADTLAALARRLLLFSTGITRDAASVLRQQTHNTRTNPTVVESLHVLKSLAEQMSAALEREQLDRFGALLHDAWQHKKQLSSKVSSRDIDMWYETAREAGALGGKIAGAGGGGFLLVYCPPRKQAAVRRAMSRCGLNELTFDFDFAGGHILESGRPASGLSDGKRSEDEYASATHWTDISALDSLYESRMGRDSLA